jgi:hypothetical protein
MGQKHGQWRGVHVTGVSAAYTFKLNKNILSESFYTIKPILNISLHSQACNKAFRSYLYCNVYKKAIMPARASPF